MKHFSKHLFIASISLALTLSAVSTSKAEAADVAGTYHCEGTNADGSHYSGKVKITSEGGAYKVHWWLAGQEYTGLGVVKQGVLAVAFYGASKGVIAYSIEDGKLSGKWSALNSGGTVLTETLTR